MSEQKYSFLLDQLLFGCVYLLTVKANETDIPIKDEVNVQLNYKVSRKLLSKWGHCNVALTIPSFKLCTECFLCLMIVSGLAEH